jgi:uncharacterized protein YndB with AHSA1/START domain
MPKNETAGMSDEAVQAKTGKTWSEWYAILDKAKAHQMDHKAMAAYLHEKQGVPGWWCQMVAVAYERERGLRAKYEKPDGFTAGRSKTLAVPLADLYAAWADARKRGKWLNEPGLVIRKATEEKSIRITWADGTSVEVMFYPKGEGKSQVTIEHNKLALAGDVEKSKAYWGEKLDALQRLLSA